MYIFPAEERMNPVAGVKLEFWKECRQPGHERSIVGATVYHVLPDDHSKTVAMIIPSCSLDFYMLTDHVEAEIFHGLDIIDQRFIRWRSVKSVRPVSLIQDSIQKKWFMVQAEAGKSFFIRFDGKGTHCKIAGDFIFACLYLNCIKIRIIRIPGMHIVDVTVAGVTAKRVRLIGADPFGNQATVHVSDVTDNRFGIAASGNRMI